MRKLSWRRNIRKRIRCTEDTGEVRHITSTIFAEKLRGGKPRKKVLLAVLFAVSGLICWCGISQVVSNSVTSAFQNAFHIPPVYTTVVLVVAAAFIGAAEKTLQCGCWTSWFQSWRYSI